jgi:hypothetical protein
MHRKKTKLTEKTKSFEKKRKSAKPFERKRKKTKKSEKKRKALHVENYYCIFVVEYSKILF